MRYMQELMARMIDVPLARMFVLAAILFLLLAVLGRIEGKIEPGRAGRIGATLLGVVLMFLGLTMHFNETDALRDKLRESMNSSPSSTARQPADLPGDGAVKLAAANQAGLLVTTKTATSPATEVQKSVIKVVSGTYGDNCGARAGNVTAPLARVCDGQARCDYKIDPSSLEDPAPACAKVFSAEWKCGTGGAVYTVSLPAVSSPGETLRLACTAP